MGSETKRQLLEQGMTLLLARGFNDLGISAVLDATRIPKGSFYTTSRARRISVFRSSTSTWARCMQDWISASVTRLCHR